MDVRLPRLGEGADSGAVAGIFVKVGERVSKDQPVLELESEKAVASIPSPASGVVTEIHVKEGDEVKVGQVLLSLDDEGAAGAGARQEQPEEMPVSVAPTGRLVREQEISSETIEKFSRVPPQGFPSPAAPSVRKLARELGIDLTKVKGSERGGRIVMADLPRYIQRLQQHTVAQPSGASPVTSTPAQTPARVTPTPAVDFSRWGQVTRKKISILRQAISRKMVQSWTTVPHVTQFDEADITGLMQLREKHAPAYKNKGAHLTLTPFVMKALVSMLKKYPVFNASMDLVTDEIVYKEYYHFGIAIDTEQGLIVPVVRDVDKKSLFDLGFELQHLAERARQRKVSLEEMQGGTFTISNQGSIGGGHFTPIINIPEVAILGVGRGSINSVVRSGKMEKRTMLPLALSYDHRVIDGADAARFVAALVEQLASFNEVDVKLKV